MSEDAKPKDLSVHLPVPVQAWRSSNGSLHGSLHGSERDAMFAEAAVEIIKSLYEPHYGAQAASVHLHMNALKEKFDITPIKEEKNESSTSSAVGKV